jgi:exonuclease SbcC
VAQLRKASEKAADAAVVAAQHLAKVKASREHLAPQVENLSTELAALTTRFEATPEPTPPDEAPNVTRLEFTCKDAQDAAMAAARELGEASQRVEQAKAADERATILEGERAQMELELADWTRLSLDLGRDGIQSAEVDSAGPELTELTNDLLLKCHGPRYSVRISTKRFKADGINEVDECLILVTDHEKNETKEGKEHSGGEKVIIGEAVSLALTMMACRRSRAKNPILIRDETGAALDPINARVYIAMLRHAAKFTHAEKIIFVSHSKEVQAMADAVITIGNDTVELEGAA